MLPNYEKFFAMENWGRPEILATSLEKVWSSLTRQPLTHERIEELTRRCEEAAPDTERFNSLYTSSALDAASALVETLRCCEDGDASHALLVGTAARDTVDMYIQMRDKLDPMGEGMEEAIARDPLMHREMRKQEKDLTDLKREKILTPDFLRALQASSSYDILS
jgi:uncharacterized protein YjaG (DUF416 family)